MHTFVTNDPWLYIFRVQYRQYKDLYKKKLLSSNENNSNQLQQLEDNLDVTNIIMAREHAKLEVSQILQWNITITLLMGFKVTEFVL